MRAQAKPEDRFLLVNGIRLHYLDWGGGARPVLLLHGFTAHAHAWDALAQALSPRYHVLALDQRGHGDSDWARDGAYATEDHLADIAGFVEALGLPRLAIIGHSMGGRNAIAYAACFPERVERLVLVDSRPASDAGGAVMVRGLLSLIPPEIGSVDEIIPGLLQLFPRLSPEMAYHLARYGFRESASGVLTPKYDMAIGAQAHRAGYAAADLWPFIQQIRCPTLIIRGAESGVLTREAALRMAEAIAGSQFIEIEGAGHLVPQENPCAFETAVRRFLEGS